jgi:hypothetical protein
VSWRKSFAPRSIPTSPKGEHRFEQTEPQPKP